LRNGSKPVYQGVDKPSGLKLGFFIFSFKIFIYICTDDGRKKHKQKINCMVVALFPLRMSEQHAFIPNHKKNHKAYCSRSRLFLSIYLQTSVQ